MIAKAIFYRLQGDYTLRRLDKAPMAKRLARFGLHVSSIVLVVKPSKIIFLI